LSVPLPLAPSPSPGLAGGTVPAPSRNPFSPNYSPNQPPGAIANSLGGMTPGMGDRPPAATSTNSAGGLGASPGTESSLHPLESALQRQATPAMPQGNTGAPLLTGVGQAVDEGGGDRLSPTGTLRLSPTLPGQPSSGSYAPQTSPPLGSTGYTVPSSIQTAPVQLFPTSGGSLPAGLQPIPLQSGGSTSPSGRQNSSDAARPQFGNGSFYAPPTGGGAIAPADPEPPPFSSSDQRGRNGQINTFSNP